MTKKPRNLDFVEAASLPYAALTALAAIKTFGGLSESNCVGKRILVLGGSGGVGTIAIQILKHWGAYVATTCSSDAIPWIQELFDVDQTIDYRSNELPGFAQSFDYVFDFAKRSDRSSIDPVAFKCLKKKLTCPYVTVSSPLLRTIDEKGLLLGLTYNLLQATRDTINGVTEGRTVRWAFYHPSLSGLLILKKLVEEERIKPIVQKTFNFDQLPKAYINVQDGHLRGKTVIQIQ